MFLFFFGSGMISFNFGWLDPAPQWDADPDPEGQK
jgi:hypothetical protein